MTDTEQDEHSDIREAVAKLCAQFPGEYWRKLDREMAYPSAFVDALTEAGYLSVLIPEEYGGAGLKLSAAAANSFRSKAPLACAYLCWMMTGSMRRLTSANAVRTRGDTSASDG